MLGKRKKRRAKRIDTLVGQHSKVLGDVHFKGGLHVDGSIKGNVYAEPDDDSATLSLSDHGSVEGEVRVPYVVLNGVVLGDVYASEHVELAANARVTGNVYYNLIEMAIGAEVNGKLVHHTEPAPATEVQPEQAEPLAKPATE